MAYDAKKSNSGLYIFNPTDEASNMDQEISLIKVFISDGDLMKCIQSMSQVSKYRDILFINKLCLEHSGANQMLFK